MTCKDCTSEVTYSRKVSLFKFVNGIRYELQVCEKCLVLKFPEYESKNKTRIFNTNNAITSYAFSVPYEEAKKSNRAKSPSVAKFNEKYGIENAQ